jgi:hypothetical protein
MHSRFSGAHSSTQSESALDNPVIMGDKQFIYFTEMRDGESFGVTSLFEEHSNRMCVVTALKPTHCLVVDNLAYKAMKRAYTLRMEAEMMALLK